MKEMRHISQISRKTFGFLFHLKQTDFLKNHLFALDFPQNNSLPVKSMWYQKAGDHDYEED